MRTFTNVALALSLAVGGLVLPVCGVGKAKADGFRIDAPGIHVRIGKRHHHFYNRGASRDYDAYAADPSHPYGYNYDYGDARCGIPNYTIQDGVCKPYRGY